MTNSHQQQRQAAAFTLIEVLVTVSLTTLVMLSMTSLFISFIVSAGKSRLSQSLRENGSSAMQKMIEELRNAKNILSVCDGNALSELHFTNADEMPSRFLEEQDKIAFIVDGNTYFLSSNPGSGNDQLRDLEFVCYFTESAKYVEIGFTLASSAATNPSASHSQLEFSSGVSLRN